MLIQYSHIIDRIYYKYIFLEITSMKMACGSRNVWEEHHKITNIYGYIAINWIKCCIINLLQGIWITLNLKESVFLCKYIVWIIFRCSFEIAGWTVLHITWVSWGIPFPPLCVKSARDLRQLDPWTQQFPFLPSAQSSRFAEDFALIFWFI